MLAWLYSKQSWRMRVGWLEKLVPECIVNENDSRYMQFCFYCFQGFSSENNNGTEKPRGVLPVFRHLEVPERCVSP